MQQPKTGAAAPMPSQAVSAQQPKLGATGSTPPQPVMGPMASVQGAGSAAKAVDMTPKVKELYSQLKQAYEFGKSFAEKIKKGLVENTYVI